MENSLVICLEKHFYILIQNVLKFILELYD